jgi:hypothetical protein
MNSHFRRASVLKPYILSDNRDVYRPHLSVIICTRNRAKSLQKCLKAINAESLKSVSGELIIVDNGSDDETVKVAEKFINEVDIDSIVLSEPRAGLSRARNTGLKYSRGDTIIFTDDDCYLDDDYINIANEIFENKPFSYCGGRILLYDKTDAKYGIMEQDNFELIPPNSFLPPGKFQGANLIIKREVYEKIGGFDQRLGAGTPFRCEDIDYVARASNAGFIGAHVPELIVYHHHRRKDGPEIQAIKKDNAYARGAFYMKFIKHRHFSYLWGWLRRSILRRRTLRRTIPVFIQELRGSFAYLKSSGEL